MKKYKDNIEYKNDFNRQKYDRIGLMLPKGTGDEWKAEALRRNVSLNAFVQQAVKFYVENCTNDEKSVQK